MDAPTDLALFLEEAEAQLSELNAQPNQCIQHLMELGYLPALPMLSSPKNPKMGKAIQQFLADFEASDVCSGDELRLLKALYQDDFAEEMLRKCMDMDEGLVFKKLPIPGEVTLVSRIQQYRLSMYGLFAFSVSQPWGFAAHLGVEKIKQYTGATDPDFALSLLACKKDLTNRILQIFGHQRCLLFVHLGEGMGELGVHPDKIHSAFHFGTLMSRDFADDERYLNSFKVQVLSSNPKTINWAYIEGQSHDELARFLVRIIQVHQWMDGFYSGKLDGELGDISVNSIVELLNFYNMDEENEVLLPSILYYIGRGYVVFNGLQFIKQYITDDAAPNDEEVAVHSLVSETRDMSEADQTRFSQHMSTVFTAAKEELAQESRASQGGIIKKVYFGIKGFFRKLFRVGKKLVKMILRNFKKVFNQLKNFIKRLLEYGRQALQSFIRAIKFILGKLPVVTTAGNAYTVTNNEFLGDSLNIINPNLSPEQLHAHSNEVLILQRALQFSMTILGEVLKLIKFMAAGALSWPIILLQLARATRTIFSNHQHIYQH